MISQVPAFIPLSTKTLATVM